MFPAHFHILRVYPAYPQNSKLTIELDYVIDVLLLRKKNRMGQEHFTKLKLRKQDTNVHTHVEAYG